MLDHLHFLCALLLILLTALLVLTAIRSRRCMRRLALEKQRYAEATHAERASVVGEMSAAIAHEVTQPLSSILNNVETMELLLRAPNPDLHEIRDILHDVKQDDLRAYDIIRGLRSLLQKRELTLQRCDINELIAGVLTLVRPEANRRGVAIHTSLDPEVPTFIADPVHVQQVLINLIVNGMQAMQETDPAKRRMEIRTALQTDGMLRIEVQDQGSGVRRRDKARLFDPYFTTKAEGMGVGLSLARSIVTLHGGAIWLAEGASRGATFVVIFPVTIH